VIIPPLSRGAARAARSALRRRMTEFEGKPLSEFEGWRKTNSNPINDFREKFEGNTGAKSAGEVAAV
jgi:hypothetical protein